VIELIPFADALTPDEIGELMEAARNNSQVRWVSADPDVKRFCEPLLESRRDNRRLSKVEYKKWRDHFGLGATE
jgi:hypothetical protein